MTLKSLRKNEKGFTLIEVLLVIAIIAILAGIVILAINPNRQLAQSNNAQRSSDVTTLLNAVYQYSIDNDGTLPASVSALVADTPTEICNAGGDCDGLVDLGVLTQNQTYLTELPADPTAATTDGTGYEIERSANNRVTVSAPSAQNSETITVTR
jgi:prepilin-type N-terminal cleavage/methylation domain-containing protein